MKIFDFLAWAFVWLGQILGGFIVIVMIIVIALVVFDEIRKLRNDLRSNDDELNY